MISQYVTRHIKCKFIRKYFSKKGMSKAGKRIVRAGHGNKMDF